MKKPKYVTVKIEIGMKVRKLIKRLHRTGLWGTGTWKRTAERILCKGLESIKLEDLERWEK